jgi:GntR family transcriptional repressor for pyruvate dehydrogenase complex
MYVAIIDQVVGLIRDGSLAIGDKLPAERELAQLFGVSRPSVREALTAMEIIGLVEIRPGGGTYIAGLNMAPLVNVVSPLLAVQPNFETEILELRRMLDTEAAELAARRVTPEQADALEQAVTQMQAAVEQDDSERGAGADIRFHELIYHAGGNTVLKTAADYVVTIIEMSIKEARELILGKPQNAVELLEQHKRILAAIKRNDPEKAARAMRDHLDYVLEFYESRSADTDAAPAHD